MGVSRGFGWLTRVGVAAVVVLLLGSGHLIGRMSSSSKPAAIGSSASPYSRGDIARPDPNSSPIHLVAAAAKLGMSALHWQVDPQDWRKPGAHAISSTVITATHSGSIVLMHDGGGNRSGTATALQSILPNLVAPITIWATLLIPANILFEAALSFLGLGVPVTTASWGSALSDAAAGGLYKDAPWMMIFPGIFLVLTTLAFNLLGDGLRDALDPRTER